MPRANTGARLILYGPDTRYGATPRKGFRNYVYVIAWYDKGQRYERSTGTSDLRGAEEALADFIARRAVEERRSGGPRAPSEMTVAESLSIYGQHHAPHVAAPERIGYAIDALVNWWGDRLVAEVTAGTCRRYAKERGRSAGTVRRELGTLRAAIKFCVTEGYLTAGAVVVLPEKPKAKERFLSRDEAAALLLAAWRRRDAGRYLSDFILLGLYLGARKEAILSLQWQQNTAGGWIDLERGMIDFGALGRVATKKRRALVPIPDRLLPHLRRIRRRTRQYVIECEGGPVADPKKSFASAAIDAGMWEPAVGKRGEYKKATISPHVLRHTCVTWKVAAGAPYGQIGAFVGMSAEMVERVYGHHAPDYMRGAANAVWRAKKRGLT